MTTQKSEDTGSAYIGAGLISIIVTMLSLACQVFILPYWAASGFLLCCLWRGIEKALGIDKETRGELLHACIICSLIGPITMIPMVISFFKSEKIKTWFAQKPRII